MSGTIHRLASARAAKRGRDKMTDAERYAYALARQRARSDEEFELIDMIGPVDSRPFGPGDAA